MKTKARLLFCSGIALLIVAIPVVLFAARAVWISRHLGKDADLRVVIAEVTPPAKSGVRFVNFGFASPENASHVIRAQAVAGNQSEADALVAKYRVGTTHRITITTSAGVQTGILPETRYETAIARRMLFASMTLPLIALVMIVLGRNPSRTPGTA